MKNNNIVNKDNDKVLLFSDKLFILSIVLNSGTELNQNTKISTILMIFSFLLVVFQKRKCCISDKRRWTLSTFIVLILFVLSVILNYSSTIIIGQVFFLFLFSYTFCFFEPEKNLERFKYFVFLILVFSFISTGLYLLVIVGVNLGAVAKENEVFSIVYLENYVIEYKSLFGIRNCGIYWEAGMYQVYLNLSLIFVLYSYKGRYKKGLVLYLVLMVLTTYSTSGLVLCACIMMFFVMDYYKLGAKKILVCIIACILLLICAPFIFSNIANKVTNGNSYSFRTDDIKIGMKLFFQSPMVGYGLFSDKYERTFLECNNIIRGNSNGIMNIFLFFGLSGVIPYVVGVSRSIKFFSIYIGNNSKYILIFWLLLSMSTEPISLHPTVFFIIGLGGCNIMNKNNMKE